MICVNIIGGLGNQMFQYAFGRAVAKESGLKVVFIDDMFTGYRITHNGSELEPAFALSLERCSRQQLSMILGRVRSLPIVRRAANQRLFRRLMAETFRHEDDLQITGGIPRINSAKDYYLQGYWQKIQYVDSVRYEILNDFTFAQPLSGLNLSLATQMAASESVSLHVRRGDYVASPKAQLKHGVLPLEYYIQAIKCIMAKSESVDLKIFAFSDDMEWVARNLKPHVPELILVEGNTGQAAHIDMHLMSLCKHHIICNSTFSWWGAWLGYAGRGMVVAPKQWFADGADSSALMPSHWVRL